MLWKPGLSQARFGPISILKFPVERLREVVMSDAGPSLAQLWEGEISLRALAREKGQLTTWPNPRCIGTPSTGAMACNIRALEILGEWWASKHELPVAIPIDTVREEAWSFRKRGWDVLYRQKLP